MRSVLLAFILATVACARVPPTATQDAGNAFYPSKMHHALGIDDAGRVWLLDDPKHP